MIPATKPKRYRKSDVPRTYPPGRVCSQCDTILSRYTKGRRCALHAPPMRATRDEQRAALDLLAELMQEDYAHDHR